jgi:integrase
MRPSEARALTRADVHLGDRPWVRVMRLKKGRPSPDDLQIPEGLAKILHAYMVYLPLAIDKLFDMSLRQSSRLFHHYRRKARVHRCPMYALRHTAATRIYRATRDIRVVQAVLGHETPDVSAIYAHIPKALLIEAADAMPPIV